jgi:hypothetical protein
MGTEAFTNFLISGGSNAELVARELVGTQCELSRAQMAIEELKKFFMKMKKQWICHLALPISVSTGPLSYTKDVRVVKLNEKMFLQNFRRNVLDLGAC